MTLKALFAVALEKSKNLKIINERSMSMMKDKSVKSFSLTKLQNVDKFHEIRENKQISSSHSTGTEGSN